MRFDTRECRGTGFHDGPGPPVGGFGFNPVNTLYRDNGQPGNILGWNPVKRVNGWKQSKVSHSVGSHSYMETAESLLAHTVSWSSQRTLVHTVEWKVVRTEHWFNKKRSSIDRKDEGRTTAQIQNRTIMRLNEPSPDLASQSWSIHDGHDA